MPNPVLLSSSRRPAAVSRGGGLMWCPDPPAGPLPASSPARSARPRRPADRGRVDQQPEAPGPDDVVLGRSTHLPGTSPRSDDRHASSRRPLGRLEWLMATFIAWGVFGPEFFTACPTTPCAEPCLWSGLSHGCHKNRSRGVLRPNPEKRKET